MFETCPTFLCLKGLPLALPVLLLLAVLRLPWLATDVATVSGFVGFVLYAECTATSPLAVSFELPHPIENRANTLRNFHGSTKKCSIFGQIAQKCVVSSLAEAANNYRAGNHWPCEAH